MSQKTTLYSDEFVLKTPVVQKCFVPKQNATPIVDMYRSRSLRRLLCIPTRYMLSSGQNLRHGHIRYNKKVLVARPIRYMFLYR